MTGQDVQETLSSNLSRQGWSLRRGWGGRLRTYRPNPAYRDSRREAVKKALVRGELVLNGFNRWRLLPTASSAIAWTFVEDDERIDQVAETEIEIARRETGKLRVLLVNETTISTTALKLEAEKNTDLFIVCRDWRRHPHPIPELMGVIRRARTLGMVVHIIARIPTDPPYADKFCQDASNRRRLCRDPLYRPLPRRSKIEMRFGEKLAAAGFHPIPQHPVANYFLDFFVEGAADGLPVRLDVEVDGRRWHEELPGVRRLSDIRRNQVLIRLGWRPVRFWADEIDHGGNEAIERIRAEASSASALLLPDGGLG